MPAYAAGAHGALASRNGYSQMPNTRYTVNAAAPRRAQRRGRAGAVRRARAALLQRMRGAQAPTARASRPLISP